MTKKIFTAIALFAAAINSQAQSDGTYDIGELKNKASPAYWNRELPRTKTISYASEKEALEGSMETSQYLQALGGEWEAAASDNGKTKTFTHPYKIPFSWLDRQVFLRVDGATGAYDIVVNGKYAGYNQSGAVPAEFDITSFSKEGANEVKIIVYTDYEADKLSNDDNRQPSLVGGTYVLSQPKVRIRDYTALVGFEGTQANFELGVILKTHLLNQKKYRVFYKLLSPAGEEVAQGYRDTELEMQSEDTVRFFMNVPNVRKWSPEKPELYTLMLKTQHAGRYGEYIAYKVGMRTVEMKEGKLLLNSAEPGSSVTGINPGGDREYCEKRLREFKNKGTGIIITEKPAQDFFYDLCDQLGMWVINQTDINTSRSGDSRAKNGNPSNDPVWEEAYKERAGAMYHTSQSHPCVIGFSLAAKSSNGHNLYESYLKLKKTESLRPVIYLDAAGEWNSDAEDTGSGHERQNGARIKLNVSY